MLSFCPTPAFRELVSDMERKLQTGNNLYDVIDRYSTRGLEASKACPRVCVASQALARTAAEIVRYLAEIVRYLAEN